MKNLNPIYEFYSLLESNNGDSGNGAALGGLIVGGSIAGATSKYIKDNLLIKRVLNKYPDPMSFKKKLLSLPGNSEEKTMLLIKLQPDTTREEYIHYLKLYLCDSSVGRYILNAMGNVFSAIGNTAGIINNQSEPVDEVINQNILRNEL